MVENTESQLIFLGTGGARVMMSRQLLGTGGMWLILNGTEISVTEISVDPGPGALVHSLRHKLKPADLDGIIISHRHLDHCGDINAMIEAMTQGGYRKKGTVFAPADALDNDPVVLYYLRKYVQNLTALQAGQEYKVGNVTFRTFGPLKHGPSTTFGFNFFLNHFILSYLPDTAYFEELPSYIEGDIIIINTVLYKPRKVLHLSVPDVKRLLIKLKPQKAIITHFGMEIWRAGPETIAEKLSRETGIEVIAARDGMRIFLNA